MAVTVAYNSQVNTKETITTNAPAVQTTSGFNFVSHTGYSTSLTLNASSTPPATKCAYFLQALTAGAATIDMTSLTGTYGAAVTGAGLRPQIVKFKATSTNTGGITITPGASNGYDIFGASSSITLTAGQEVTLYRKDGGVDIDATHKTIDLAGTGTESLECTFIFG